MRVARREARAELADERAGGHWVDPAEDVLDDEHDDHAVDHR